MLLLPVRDAVWQRMAPPQGRVAMALAGKNDLQHPQTHVTLNAERRGVLGNTATAVDVNSNGQSLFHPLLYSSSQTGTGDAFSSPNSLTDE